MVVMIIAVILRKMMMIRWWWKLRLNSSSCWTLTYIGSSLLKSLPHFRAQTIKWKRRLKSSPKKKLHFCFTLALFHCRDIHSGLDSQTKCVTLCGWTSSTTLQLSTCWLTQALPSSPKWHFSETQKLHYQLWQKSVNHFQRIGVGHLWFLAWICMFALAWTEKTTKKYCELYRPWQWHAALSCACAVVCASSCAVDIAFLHYCVWHAGTNLRIA